MARPLFQPVAVQAQGIPLVDAQAQAQGLPLPAQGRTAPTLAGSAQMLVDKDNSMYVMLNGKVYVYTREDEGRLHWVLWQILSPGQDVPQRVR